jgi:HEAT repeat protein
MALFGLFGPPNVEKLKRSEDVEGLKTALVYPKDARVRVAALLALWDSHKSLRPCDQMDLAVESLDDDSPEVRQAAAGLLGSSSGAASYVWGYFMSRTDPANRELAVQILESCRGYGTLIAALGSSDKGAAGAALSAIALMKPEGLAQELVAAFENIPARWYAKTDLSGETRRRAKPRLAGVLAQLSDTEFLENLAGKGERRDGAGVAVEALGRKQNDAALEALERLIRNDRLGTWLRSAAVDALGGSAGLRRADLLTEIARQHPADDMGRCAAAYLAGFGNQAAPLMASLLGHGEADVRCGAAKALARRGRAKPREPADPAVVLALRSLLADASFRVREGAAEALDAMNCPPENQTERLARAIALQRMDELKLIGEAAFDPLCEAVRVKGWCRYGESSAWVLNTLVELGGVRAADTLASVVEFGDREAEDALRFLEKLLTDSARDLEAGALDWVTMLPDREFGPGDVDHYFILSCENARKLAQQELRRRRSGPAYRARP